MEAEAGAGVGAGSLVFMRLLPAGEVLPNGALDGNLETSGCS